MNTNGNSYTILYSAVMVIVVAALLSITAEILKEPQARNTETEKKLTILSSVGKGEDAGKAKDKYTYVAGEYSKYITEAFCVNSVGEKTSAEAFLVDFKSELEKPEAERNYPVFVCNNSGLKYILPVSGPGLWGPLWGYIALDSDFNTVYGAVFDHKGETPGLGAEISTPVYQSQFKGKQIFENTAFTGIKVEKPGSPLTKHSVDGISGGTITSQAVQTMVFKSLKAYIPFMEKQKKLNEPEPEPEIINEESVK